MFLSSYKFQFILLVYILQSICIFHISRYQEHQEIMIFNNSHYTMVIQTLQNDLSQLENHFLKFKLIVNQSSINQTNLQSLLNNQLDNINSTVLRFCNRIQSEIANIQSKLILLSSKKIPCPQNNPIQQDQKYNVVCKKICMLEQKLRQTEKNQSKLIQAISILMRKYQISQEPTMIQNDENLQKKFRISQVTLAANEKNCGFGGNRSLESSISSRQKLNKTLKKNESNIYLLNNNDYSQEKHHFYESKHFLRTFSKPSPNLKISLKQISNPIASSRHPFQTITKQTGKSDNRASSLDRHQHRLQFMMNKLHE